MTHAVARVPSPRWEPLGGSLRGAWRPEDPDRRMGAGRVVRGRETPLHSSPRPTLRLLSGRTCVPATWRNQSRSLGSATSGDGLAQRPARASSPSPALRPARASSPSPALRPARAPALSFSPMPEPQPRVPAPRPAPSPSLEPQRHYTLQHLLGQCPSLLQASVLLRRKVSIR
ncbi:hypothetical protein P7K49_001820 [Saguinus oedipus]|uniref:Uncharacterized protein n=1 Tax=Saguinus oedipus TaxID=9490 RepID=A0ABQ9WFK6_SAGOE|nr:hypothetical protein P7K49_001820 [Saguinus oedipus]